MTMEMFQAVKFGSSKGPGASSMAAGHWVLEDGSGKEGEPERADNIDHTAITINHSKARHKLRQVVDTGPALMNFASIPYWRNCTFT